MTLRTAEQVAADDALTEAIQTVARAYDVIDTDEVVMGYVLSGYAQSLATVESGCRFLQLFKDNGSASLRFTHEGLLREGMRSLLEQDDD